MESHSTISGHLVLLCAPAWGHFRQLCALASKAVRERPDIAITFLSVGVSCQRLEHEISRYFSVYEANGRARGNIRLVNMGGHRVFPSTFVPITLREFPGYYDKLVNCQSIQCSETKRVFDVIPKPTAVVLDFFLLDVFRHIRSVTGKHVPVFSWESGFAAVILHLRGPEKLGGFGDVETKARIQAEATGRKVKDIIHEMYHPAHGRLITVPGLPPMYDYEWFPQQPTLTVLQNHVTMAAYTYVDPRAYGFVRECDGIISVSSAAYDPKSLEALRMWLGETNRPVYALGPLVPPGLGDRLSDTAQQMEIGSSNNGKEVQAFLDKILKSHGKHCLIYISFGSFWWPRNTEYVWILVDALLDLEFPFILSCAAENADIPPGYGAKLNQSGTALLSAWSPQQTILNHPVTGWFLTHCGQNSITEALASGIPMIAWPLDADQPGNAAYITLSLDVAFELVEVRTGGGLRPLYRGVQPTGTMEAIASEARTILQKARGPEGVRKRRNAEELRDKWKKEWEEGGDALNNLRGFLADCCNGMGRQPTCAPQVPNVSVTEFGQKARL